jgi:tripartite-type tricarboxylate transporter receptor subunit TctC
VRALAVTSAARVPELPDVPTMAEAGVPDFEVTSWNALYGPKDMPQDAADTLARATTEILKRPEVIAKYATIGSWRNRSPPMRSRSGCGPTSRGGRG